jgi:membrane protease subunit (stomatin/prohibitin family)
VESKEAVRQAVLDHLAKRAGINLASMQVDVVSVVFRQNEADAAVSFRAKGSTGGPAMTMNYTLVKQGNGWVVKGRADTGASPHGAAGQMPMGTAGQMPMGTPGQMPMGVPPGHPQVGGQPPPETRK